MFKHEAWHGWFVKPSLTIVIPLFVILDRIGEVAAYKVTFLCLSKTWPTILRRAFLDYLFSLKLNLSSCGIFYLCLYSLPITLVWTQLYASCPFCYSKGFWKNLPASVCSPAWTESKSWSYNTCNTLFQLHVQQTFAIVSLCSLV